jgi:hypothetical protein
MFAQLLQAIAAQQATAPAAAKPAWNPYSDMTGQTLTKDSGGYRLGGARVLDQYKSVFDAGGTDGFASALADVWRDKGYDQALLDEWNSINSQQEGVNYGGIGEGAWGTPPPQPSDALMAKIKEIDAVYRPIRLGHAPGENSKTRRITFVDRNTGQAVSTSDPFRYTSWKEAPIEAISTLGSAMLMGNPAVGAALGSALGATGTAATAIGNGVIQGGMSAATGGDFVKGALGGALGAYAAPIAGAAGQAVGGGLAGSLASGGVNALMKGAINGNLSGDALLAGALSGGLNYGVNAGINGLVSSLAPAQGDGKMFDFNFGGDGGFSLSDNGFQTPSFELPTYGGDGGFSLGDIWGTGGGDYSAFGTPAGTGGGINWSGALKGVLGSLSGALTGSGGGGAAPGTTGGSNLFGQGLSIYGSNQRYQDAKDDQGAAYRQYLEAQGFNKEQIDRVVGLAGTLQGQVTSRLGQPTAASQVPGYVAPTTKLASEGDLSANPYVLAGKQNAAATAGVGAGAASADAEAKAALSRVLNDQGVIRSKLDSLGDRKMYGEEDVNRIAGDLYAKRTGAADRALALAGSQGFAGALRSGLSNSTFAADTRDSIARRFADVYAGIDANSRAEAGQIVRGLSDLQETQRGGTMSEVLKAYDPSVDASAYQTGRGAATQLLGQHGQLSANDAQRGVDAIRTADAASQISGNWAVDGAKTAYEGALRAALARDQNDSGITNSLVNALTSANQQALHASTGVNQAAAEYLKAATINKGAAANDYYASLAPVGNAVGSVVNPFLQALLSGLGGAIKP